MSAYSVAEAKDNLADLIDGALKGEEVVITRHGTPVVKIRAVEPTPAPVADADIEWLAARRAPAHPGVETPCQSLAAPRDATHGRSIEEEARVIPRRAGGGADGAAVWALSRHLFAGDNGVTLHPPDRDGDRTAPAVD